MIMDIYLVFFILCIISFESSKGFLFPSHVHKYKRSTVTSPLSFQTNFYSSQAIPDEFQNDCTANVALINVNYLQLVRKLNMVGVIELFEFEFSTCDGSMPHVIHERTKLWDKAVVTEMNAIPIPRRLFHVLRVYESYCSDLRLKGLVPNTMGELIVELIAEFEDIYERKPHLLDNYTTLILPADLLTTDQVTFH